MNTDKFGNFEIEETQLLREFQQMVESVSNIQGLQVESTIRKSEEHIFSNLLNNLGIPLQKQISALEQKVSDELKILRNQQRRFYIILLIAVVFFVADVLLKITQML